MSTPSPALASFLARHQLPSCYLYDNAPRFQPIIDHTLSILQHKRPVIIGCNGSQGSGKSTLSDYLVTVFTQEHQLTAISLSLDDVYLSHSERQQLADNTHPLLATRGVPGTHNVSLALQTLEALSQQNGAVAVPRFDKSSDDPCPVAEWPVVETPVDVIVLEGWCLGAEAQNTQALSEPLNQLEREQDTDGAWRQYVNHCLSEHYPALFDTVDIWVMLRAPSFACVQQWRIEQERKLANKLQVKYEALESNGDRHPGLMSASQIAHFVQYFQRLTEHMLDSLPAKVHHLYELDTNRHITHERHHRHPV